MITKWQKELETGIEEIDEQHKYIISMLGKLIYACTNNDEKEEILQLIKEFEDYSFTHIESENKYMREHCYEDYPSHYSVHEIFKMAYLGMKQQYSNDDSQSNYIYQVCKILTNWEIWHINSEDRDLAIFLKTKLQNK